MPVRSLTSSVLKWVSKEEVEEILKNWALKLKKENPEIKKIGYFGSYARGDWGVGSDLDVLIIVEKTKEPFLKRALKFDIKELPLPAHILVYTEEELEKLKDTRFYKEVIAKETLWVI